MKSTLFGAAAAAAALAFAVPAAAQTSQTLEVAANPQTNRLVTISAFDSDRSELHRLHRHYHLGRLPVRLAQSLAGQ